MLYEDGGIQSDVLCTKDTFNKLEFPTTKEDLGSLLVWVSINNSSQPIVVGVLSKNEEFINSKEHTASLSKSFKSNNVEITVNAKTGEVVIGANSNDKESGKVLINSTSRVDIVSEEINNKSKTNNISSLESLNITVKDLTIDNKETTISITKGEGIELSDEFGNTISITEDGFAFNGGDLGGMVKINDLITKLNNLENAYNTLSNIYNTHTHIDFIVGLTGLSTTPNTTVITPTILQDLEDDKVKH
jgi:ribonuclease BN (tRNA processing enzyme)